MRYVNENELREVLKSFETATIARDEWGHPEHLIVAYFYCSELETEAAYLRMKAGIHKLLVAFGIDREKEMPYHETLTRFWIMTVGEFVLEHSHLAPLDACETLITRFGKDHPLRFYSRELLFSDRARAEFVAPDLNPLGKRSPSPASQV